MSNTPFTAGQTVSLAATATTGRVALGLPLANQAHISSLPGDDPVYIKFGDSTVEAATTDMRINPGQTQIFTVPATATHVAAICDTSETAALRITSGVGD